MTDLINYIFNRNIWDKSVDQFQKIANLDDETEVIRYTLKSMKPHLNREFVEFRAWKVDLQKQKYALICSSLNNFSSFKLSELNHTVKADCYHAHFLIENGSHSNKLRIVYLSRIDLK